MGEIALFGVEGRRLVRSRGLDGALTWLDTTAPTPREVAELLGARGTVLNPSAAALEIFCAPDDAATRPFIYGATTLVWTFGATTTDSRTTPFVAELQPVRILTAKGVVLTNRLPGVRYAIDPPSAAHDGDAILLERLHAAAESELQASPEDDSVDRDLLLVALLRGLLRTVFEARAQIAQVRTSVDFHFFSELAAARDEASGGTPTVERVDDLASRGTLLVDSTRARLTAIHSLNADLREWFDDLKPAGRNDTRIWSEHTTRPTETKALIERIYQVRNDLGRLRRDVHSSMVLLASADTGAQLVAVRALLDRTESARRAGIVAAALTLFLAGSGLVAAIATIPAAGVHFKLGRAVGFAGLLELTAVGVGVFVALAASTRRGRLRGVNTVAAGSYLASLVAFAVVATGPPVVRLFATAAGIALAVGALVLAALGGDFGGPRSRPVVSACTRLVGLQDTWSGTTATLYVDACAVTTRLERWGRGWPRSAEEFLVRLRVERLALERIGVHVNEEGGSVTLRRRSAPR